MGKCRQTHAAKYEITLEHVSNDLKMWINWFQTEVQNKITIYFHNSCIILHSSSENGLPEYVGYANCIEYKIKICHKYFTIPVWIKTKGTKLPSSTFGFIKSCVRYV